MSVDVVASFIEDEVETVKHADASIFDVREDGSLALLGDAGRILAAYAAGTWRSVTFVEAAE